MYDLKLTEEQRNNLVRLIQHGVKYVTNDVERVAGELYTVLMEAPEAVVPPPPPVAINDPVDPPESDDEVYDEVCISEPSDR